MARFFVIHKLPDAATQDEIITVGKVVLTQMPEDTRWLRSWLVSEDGHIFCEWEAPSEEAIQAALKGVELFPVKAIYPVELIDPAWLEG